MDKKTTWGIACCLIIFFTFPKEIFPQSTLPLLEASLPKEAEIETVISPELKYQEYIVKALFFLEHNQHQKAQELLNQAKALLPQMPEAYINLAAIHIQYDSPENALPLLDKAKSLASADYSKKDVIFCNLGLCTYLNLDYETAAQYYQESLESNPDLGEALYGLGMCYQNLGQTQKALASIYKAKHVFEKTNNVAYLATINDTLVLLEQSVTEDTLVLSEQFLNDGSLAFKDNDQPRAIALMKKSILLNPKNAEAYYRLGVIYTHTEKFARAVCYFEYAIKLDPNFTKAYINLGGVYGKLKKYSEALETLNAALQLDKDNPKIYYNIGMVYVAKGKKEIAKKHFKKAEALCQQADDLTFLEKIKEIYKKL